MTLILILFVSGLLYGFITHKSEEAKQESAPCEIATVYDAEEAERDRKQAAKKARAEREIETAQATLNDLDLLMDAAQRRYYAATKDKDIEKAQRQVIALRKQIAAQVEKIEKAKFIVKYGG